MVYPIDSEVNVSLVRVNEGSGITVRGSMANNLNSTDKYVVNSSLLHPDLNQPQTSDSDTQFTSFWGDVSETVYG